MWLAVAPWPMWSPYWLANHRDGSAGATIWVTGAEVVVPCRAVNVWVPAVSLVVVNLASPAASAVACPITVDPSTNDTAPVPGDTRAVRVSGWSATVAGFDEVSTSGAAPGAAYRTVAVSPRCRRHRTG